MGNRAMMAGVVCAALCLLASVAHGAGVTLTESSSPSGILARTTATYTGAIVTLTEPPTSAGDLRFTHWTLNGIEQRDALGRGITTVQFTILENVAAVANYTAVDEDSDPGGADGVPDWYEIHVAGDLDGAADSDADSDGLTLDQEYRRDSHLNLVDEMLSGGISVRLASSPTVVNWDAGHSVLSVEADPPDLLSASGTVCTNGSDVELTDASGIHNGYRFVGWEVDGVRQVDALGRAVGAPTVTVSSDTAAVAVFVSDRDDTDDDGIADWFELTFYGDLDETAASNTDGDAFDLDEEYRRDYHPGLEDEIVPGGVSVRLASSVAVDFNAEHAVATVSADPAGLLEPESVVHATDEAVTVADVYGVVFGFRFSYWELDGVQQRDSLGRAFGGLAYTSDVDTAAVAVFTPDSLDSDDDTIPDWYELHFYGDLDEDEASNTDGDAFTLDQEYRRDYHPGLLDEIVDGGVSVCLATSVQVDLQYYPSVEEVLVDGYRTAFFTKPGSTASGDALDMGTVSSPALGDWDGDGDLDLFVGGAGGVLRVFENQGSPVTMNLVEASGFADRIPNLPSGNVYPAIADWSGDGTLDLAIGSDDGSIRLYAGDGSWGSRSDLTQLDDTLAGMIPAFMDVDGDTWVDLLALQIDGTVDLYTHTGDGQAPYDDADEDMLGTTVSGGSGIATADVTDDGYTDILISDSGGRIWEFHNDGSGNFTLASQVFAGSYDGFVDTLAVAAGDVDGDGDVDIIGGAADGTLVYLRSPQDKLTVDPPVQTVLAGESLTFAAADADGDVTWEMIRNDSGGTVGETSGLYTAGSTAGIDAVEATDSTGETGRGWVNVVETSQVSAAGKALIVAGRRSANDSVWPATTYLAETAYDALRYRGLSAETIHYLSHDADANGVDGESTLANLQWALTDDNLVATTDPALLIYLVDHGRLTDGTDGEFLLSETESFTGTELRQWLDTFETAHPNTEVTVVIECCYAGALMDSLLDGYAGSQRAVIASAAADELAHFISTGLVSFSNTFWGDVALGLDLTTSFADAAAAMARFQTPDADTYGVDLNEPIGPDFIAGADRPQIGSVSDPQTLTNSTTATITAGDISSASAVARVWGIVVPPGYSPSGDAPVVSLPEIEIEWNSGTRQWEAEYGGFSEGDAENPYTVILYAQDIWGAVSFPRETSVTQTGNRSRAVIMVAGSAAPATFRVMSALGNYAYDTLQQRRMDADDIYYLSDDDDIDTRRGPASAASLQTAIETWSTTDITLNSLFVYLTGVGEATGIRCANNDLITPAQVAQWLDTVQAASDAKVVLIVECDYSGIFMAAATTQHERIVVTSTKSDSTTMFGPGGWTAFGRWFWGGVSRGESVRQAFATTLLTSRAMALTPDHQLDDTGDGVYEPKQEGYVAQTWYLGSAFVTGSDPITIGSGSGAQYVPLGGAALLWADDISSPDGEDPESVWAEVVQVSSGRAVGDTVYVELAEDAETGRYQAVFDDFDGAGLYVAYIYAGDPDDPAGVSQPLTVRIYYGSDRPDAPDPGTITQRELPLDGTYIDDSLESGDDAVRYWFESVTGERLTFELSGLDAGRDLQIKVLDAALSELDSADDWGEGFGESIWSWEPPADGTYFLQVNRADGNQSADFRVQAVREQSSDGDAYEDDDTSSRARFVMLGDGVYSEHNFHDAGDTDWVVFYAYSGVSYAIEVNEEGINCDTVVTLFDTDATTQLDEANATTGAGEQIAWLCPANGVYYVRIKHSNSTVSGTGTDYRLEIYATTGAVTGFLAGTLSDAAGAYVAGTVALSSGQSLNTTTGYYVMSVYPGDYTATATVSGYGSKEEDVTIAPAETVILDFSLSEIVTLDVDRDDAIDSRDVDFCFRYLFGHDIVASGVTLPDGETSQTVSNRIAQLVDVPVAGYARLDIDHDGSVDFRDLVFLNRRMQALDTVPAGVTLPSGESQTTLNTRIDELLAQ